MNKIYNFYNEKQQEVECDFIDVISPLTGKVISKVEDTKIENIAIILQSASNAQKQWSNLTFKARANVFFKYRELLVRDFEEICKIIHEENGKSLKEAGQEVLKAIELTEFATSIPSIISGGVQVVSRGVEVKEFVKPKGIVTSIVPFNFPMMVPHWTIPSSIVCGNAMIIKASEQTPLTMTKVGELLKEAGLPDGIFNVINGGKNVVEELCSSKFIDVVTFVGSSKIAKIVYKLSSENLIPCLALGEAKNFIIVDDTINCDEVSSEIIESAFGMSGQRCMAASVIISVGKDNNIKSHILEKARLLIEGTDLPPLASIQAKKVICKYIKDSISKGSSILLNGTEFESSATNSQYLIRPTIIEHSKCEQMEDKEIFGPLIELISVETIEEAIELQNNSKYGNGASIYTSSGYTASYVSERLTAGMVGINVGVPVPREPYGFGGCKNSRYGVGEITGRTSLNLFTDKTKITTKWSMNNKNDWMS